MNFRFLIHKRSKENCTTQIIKSELMHEQVSCQEVQMFILALKHLSLKNKIFSFKHLCSCTSIRLIFCYFHQRSALAATACFCLIPLLQFKGLKGSHLAQLAGPYQRPAWPALAGCRGQLKQLLLHFIVSCPTTCSFLVSYLTLTSMSFLAFLAFANSIFSSL